MRKIVFGAILVAVNFLPGCDKKDSPSSSAIDAAQGKKPTLEATPPKPKYTENDWKRDFSSVFEERGAKINEDGVKSYAACFDPGEGKKCGIGFSGRGDGFRKVEYLTPIMTSLSGIGDVITIIDMHIAARACNPAVALISPSFNSTNGWIFMNKIAFMADGEVVYEKSIEGSDVRRDNEGRWVHERASIKLEEDDFSRLQKFSQAKTKIIRITGEKGYHTVGKNEVNTFASEINGLVSAMNRINDALKKGGGAACSP